MTRIPDNRVTGKVTLEFEIGYEPANGKEADIDELVRSLFASVEMTNHLNSWSTRGNAWVHRFDLRLKDISVDSN